jgi:hypothetical protein
MVQPWKMLVYIAADNSLYHDAQVSLEEITAATLFSDVETLVQVDGPSAELSSRYRCSGGSKNLIWEAPTNYTDDRKVRLAEFLEASVEKPIETKRIFLVLWGHGAGLDHVYFYRDSDQASLGEGRTSSDPTPSESPAITLHSEVSVTKNGNTRTFEFAPLDLFNGANPNRYVSDIALADVLSDFSKLLNRKIDLLGFDACMMAMVEIWHEISDSTAAVVASDEEVPKGSWPYSIILSDLAKYRGMDAGTLSTVIVSRFLERYSMQGHPTRVSLSACNLSGCTALAEAMKGLVDALNFLVPQGTMRRRVFRARDSSRTTDEKTYIDLGNFLKELCESFDQSDPVYKCAQQVLNVLTGFPYVVYSRGAREDKSIDAYGVALYFPETLSPTDSDLRTFAAQNQLQVGKKFPPGPGKFPPGHGKFPPGHGKASSQTRRSVTAGTVGDQEIDGYEILWNRYQELEFNKVTGWARLVEDLISKGY